MGLGLRIGVVLCAVWGSDDGCGIVWSDRGRRRGIL